MFSQSDHSSFSCSGGLTVLVTPHFSPVHLVLEVRFNTFAKQMNFTEIWEQMQTNFQEKRCTCGLYKWSLYI